MRSEAEALKNEGNKLFLASEFHNAMRTYTQALLTCPLAFDKDRAILYANRAAASIKHGVRILFGLKLLFHIYYCRSITCLLHFIFVIL